MPASHTLARFDGKLLHTFWPLERKSETQDSAAFIVGRTHVCKSKFDCNVFTSSCTSLPGVIPGVHILCTFCMGHVRVCALNLLLYYEYVLLRVRSGQPYCSHDHENQRSTFDGVQRSKEGCAQHTHRHIAWIPWLVRDFSFFIPWSRYRIDSLTHSRTVACRSRTAFGSPPRSA